MLVNGIVPGFIISLTYAETERKLQKF